jgi:hypothetical protein
MLQFSDGIERDVDFTGPDGPRRDVDLLVVYQSLQHLYCPVDVVVNAVQFLGHLIGLCEKFCVCHDYRFLGV